MKESPYAKNAFSIKLPINCVEKLDLVREPLEVSRSTLIRRAIREFLERNLPTQTKSAEGGTNSLGA